MIGLLRGPVVLRTAECEVIVDVAGVGYRVTVTPATAAALAAAGTSSEATLYVHTHVREDAIVLYGFAHDDVQAVHSNADIADEVLASFDG